ncbi:hypothetical protein [Thermocrinis sp.]
MFVSLQFKPEFENKQDKEKVLALMRLQSSAIGKWQRRASRLVPFGFGGRNPSILGE